MNNKWVLLFLPATMAFSGCCTHCFKGYSFSTPVNWSIENPKDTISVGDTLWLSANFGDMFYDVYSNTTVRFPEARISGTHYGPTRFLEMPVVTNGIRLYFEGVYYNQGFPSRNIFEYVLDKGDLFGNAVYQGGQYSYRLGLIPKSGSRGSYFITFKFHRGAREGKKCECGEEGEFSNSELEPVSRQNFKQFLDRYGIPVSSLKENLGENFKYEEEAKQIFCFVVK